MVHTREKQGTQLGIQSENSCQIQGIIIQCFMEAIRKEDAENEEKSVNEMDRLDSLLMCSGLCSLTPILFSFCIPPANCIWAQKGAVTFIQLRNQKILGSDYLPPVKRSP